MTGEERAMSATPKALGLEGVHSVQGSFRGGAPKSSQRGPLPPLPCTQFSILAEGGRLGPHPGAGDRGG